MTIVIVGTFAGGFALGSLLTAAIIRHYNRAKHRPRHRAEGWARRHFALIAALLLLVFDVIPTVGVGYLYMGQRDLTDKQGDQIAASKAQIVANRRQIACQGRVNRALVETLRSRADASRGAILAPQPFFHALLPALTTPDATKAQQKALLAQLVAANKAANDAYDAYLKSQKANPLPPLPKKLCDPNASGQ